MYVGRYDGFPAVGMYVGIGVGCDDGGCDVTVGG